MIKSFESQAEDAREERPAEKFLLEFPSSNSLVPEATLTIKSQRDGFAIEPSPTPHEGASTLSSDVLSKLARSAKRNVLRFPKSARAHANLGAALLKAEKFIEAEQELRTALDAEPGHYLAAMTLAKLYTQQGKSAEAEDLYNSLVSTGCSEPLVFVNLANLAINRGDYQRAAEVIGNVTSLQPLARHYVIGLLRMQEGNHREAIRELKAALRTDIRQPQLNHALGVAYATSGDYRRAEKYLRAALTLAPNSAATVSALGTVLLEAKRAVEAVELMHSYLEQHPSDWSARELLGLSYLELSKWSMARTQFKLVLSSPDSISTADQARLYSNLGFAYLSERDYREAEKRFTRSLELNDRVSPITYENYARTLIFGFEDHPRALELLRRSKRIFPDSVATRLLSAAVYGREGQFQSAIDELKPVYSPQSPPELQSQLGFLYLAMGDLDQALSVLRAAFLRYPTHCPIINNLAYALLTLGEIQEAREVIRSYPKATEAHPEFLATQGLLRLYMNDLDAARRLYKRAEAIAKKASDKDLARRVRQKMHLELAKYFLRNNNLAEAQKHIRSSRSENVRFYSYADEIDRVSRLIEGT